MKTFKYILADDSYIIREGIKSILNNYPKVELLFEGNVEHVLGNASLLEKTSLLVINTDQLTPDYLSKIKNAKVIPQLHICGIGEKKLSKNSREIFNKLILLSASKETFYQELDELIKPNTKESENTSLSAREQNILKHIAKGMTNNEIAEALFISTHTVMTHRKNITRKLGIKTVSGLTVYALLNNIVHLEELQ